MSPRWAVSLPLEESESLRPLRRWADIETCTVGNTVWLRAGTLEEERWAYFRRLPGADRYAVLEDGQLLPVGRLVPRGQLPPGPWVSLAAWIRVEMPPVNDPTFVSDRITVRLERSAEEREAHWLKTTLTTWSSYATKAAQIRLARWMFVVDRQGDVIVRGTPLPPLPGELFVEQKGIAVPVGWRWAPAIAVDVLREALALSPGACAMWTPDNVCRIIAPDDWVAASRSAVRLTVEERAQ